MEMTIIYIILISLLIGIVWHIFYHIMVIFHQDTTDIFVKKVMEDPYKYVRDEEACYFLRNMVYLFFVIVSTASFKAISAKACLSSTYCSNKSFYT